MIRVSEWAEMRHLHQVQGVSKKELSRRFGRDIKTVRRALARPDAPVRRKPVYRGCILDAYREKIAAWMAAEPRISGKRVWVLLSREGVVITTRAVSKYLAKIRRKTAEVFIHRTAEPGDAMEVDFGESWARLGGRPTKVHVVVVTPPASNAYFARAYRTERAECLFDGMLGAFQYFGGMPRRVVLDNTSLAVRQVLRGPDRIESAFFAAFRGALGLHADFCAPAKGWEKGSVETGVRYMRGLFFRPMPIAEDLAALNAALLAELDQDLDRRRVQGRTAREALAAERALLRPLPPHLPEPCRIVPVLADKFAHIRHDGVRYSVPSEHARERLLAKLFPERVEIVREDKVIAVHVRSFTPGALVLDPFHVLDVLERKHRAVPEATAIRQWELPAVFHALHAELKRRVRKPHQEWVRVLRLLRDHPVSAVEAAVAEALRRGAPGVASVQETLRQSAQTPPAVPTVVLAREDLTRIRVEPAVLAAYDAVGRRP